VSRLERITSDPAVSHGQPTIRGLRYTVESIFELLSAGMTIDEVLGDYPDLEREDILAALGPQLHAEVQLSRGAFAQPPLEHGNL
jgi:uncharacterized protein (DUF433 family)